VASDRTLDERRLGRTFPHAEHELVKARLILEIDKIINRRGLTEAKAGKILGIKQPHVSALMRNRSWTLSLERLIEFLTELGQDVEITVPRRLLVHCQEAVGFYAPSNIRPHAG
jgi:predicted XRE-type DNA-binding protein